MNASIARLKNMMGHTAIQMLIVSAISALCFLLASPDPFSSRTIGAMIAVTIVGMGWLLPLPRILRRRPAGAKFPPRAYAGEDPTRRHTGPAERRMRDAELLFLTGLLQLGLFSGASEQSGTDMPLPVATSFFALSVGAFVASALLAVTHFGVVRSELMVLCALVPTLAVVFNFVGGAIAASVGLSLVPAVTVALAVLASLLALAPVVEARVTGLVVRSHQHVVLFGGGTAIAAILSVARLANGDPLSTGFTLMLAAAVGLTFAPLISVVAMRRRGAR